MRYLLAVGWALAGALGYEAYALANDKPTITQITKAVRYHFVSCPACGHPERKPVRYLVPKDGYIIVES